MDIKQRSDHTKIRFGNKLILQQRTNINTAVSRACLKNHSRHLYVPVCAIFASNSIDIRHCPLCLCLLRLLHLANHL